MNNEIAVAAFLDRRLPFVAITEVIEAVMNELRPRPWTSLDDVLEADAAARRHAVRQVEAAEVKL